MSEPGQPETPSQPHHHSVASEHVSLISEDELCLDLINSEHFDYRGRKGRQDNLEQPQWIQAFSEHWHLPVASLPDASALTSLRTLRSLLRQMFETMTAAQQINQVQVEQLNEFLRLTPMTRQLRYSEGGMYLETIPLHTGWNAVLTLAAVSWVELLARTPAACLRVCANPACHWVFVDQSRSQSRRWCRPWACGNLMKVRHFRARRTQSE